MEDLYLTKRDLDNSIDKGNAIDKLVKNKRCRILIDLDSDTVSKMVDDPSCEILFSYLRDNDKTLYSGKEMVDAIKETVEKKSDNLSNGFSRSMLLLNEKDTEFAKMVERHFGIKCVLGKKGIIPLKDGRAPFFEEGEKGSWDNTFSGVSVTPCNAIIINDHYLKGDSGTKNLIDIIRNLSKQRAHDVTLHILVIYSGGKDGTKLDNYHKSFSEQAKNTADELAKLDAEMNYLLEYLYCDNTNSSRKLYQYTHDRFAISNYTSMDASHALDLFNEKGKVKTEQKVTVGNLFYEDTLKMNDTFIGRIAKEIKEGIKDSKNNPYKYIRYDIIKGECIKSDCTDLSKIQNRFIVDELSIKEGEKCYYLSVPNDNDWTGTKILQGFYTAVNYSKCIVSSTEKELEEKKNELQQLFSKECEAPENDDDKYWRVVVTGQSNIKTVHALESKSGEKVCNQVNNYLNNCFKYKEDALQRVDEIKAVLGIE